MFFRRKAPTPADVIRAAVAFARGSSPRTSWPAFKEFSRVISPVCHAQIGQDAWAIWLTNAKQNGFFVEIGTGDGVHFSNTFVLEKMLGWAGILAEPHPHFQDTLQESRTCYLSDKCVFSTSGQTLSFMAAKVAMLSRITDINPDDRHEKRREDHELITVNSISLNDLLFEANAPKDIDYMSVDTEGSEFEILSHFDFDRWNVRALTVEHNHTSMRKNIFELLSQKGYERIWPNKTRFDDWYVRR